MFKFTCCVCGRACSAVTLDRETPSCAACGSNVRIRWVAAAVSIGLFGRIIPLPQLPERKQVRGLGLSDPLPVAQVLANRFDYVNTCYDREPRFDIMEPPRAERQFDFIIASEVFEHVEPPVQTAFDNLARLLKPGGFAVFSSPWESEGSTVEHFPHLHDWKLVPLRSGPVLLNRRSDGQLETFDNLNFHGGPGSTLEMRVFSKQDLLANFHGAGFTGIAVAEDFAEYGIVWEPWARGFILRRRQSL